MRAVRVHIHRTNLAFSRANIPACELSAGALKDCMQNLMDSELVTDS